MSTSLSTPAVPVVAHGDVHSRTGPAYAWLAATRIAVGFLMLWAFLDKLFGLGYSTPAAKSWLNGGSPTNGFLSHVAVGPLRVCSSPSPGRWWSIRCSCSRCWASASP